MVKGTKIRMIESLGLINNTEEIGEIVDVTENEFTFRFNLENEFTFAGTLSKNLFDKYFVVVEEECDEYIDIPVVTEEYIQNIMNNSNIVINTLHDKCTVVSAELPNGFVITESVTCTSHEDYDEEIGAELCLDKIEERLWELEEYRLQCELHELLSELDENEETMCDGCGECGACCEV